MGGEGLKCVHAPSRIVERWMKAAETQWGAAPHRPGWSQGRTLVLSLIYGADSMAAGSAHIIAAAR